MVIGSVGNGITIIIMTRRRMRSSTNNYLAALAIFDMLYLIFTFILSLSHYPNIKQPQFLVYWQLRPFALWITDGCAYASVWVTVTFTIERYIVVSHPIKGKVICTEARARKVVIIVFVLCFLFTSPTPFEHNVTKGVDKKTNLTIVENEWSNLGKNETYRSIYYWLSSLLFTFIPLLLLAVFNTFLIRSVHISRKQRSDMTQSRSQVRCSPRTTGNSSTGGGGGGGGFNSHDGGGERSNVRTFMTTSGVASRLEQTSSQQEAKITLMLIAVVILFMVCQLPPALMLVFTAVHEFKSGSKGFYITVGLNNIFNFLVAINAAGNFFLYSFFSQRYRRTFVSLFCPCYKNRLGYLQSTCTTTNTTVYTKHHRAKDQNGEERQAASDDGHHLKDLNSKCKKNDSLNPIPKNEEPLPASLHGQPHSSFNGIT